MILEDWIRDASIVQSGSWTVSATSHLVFGPDPMRFHVAIGPTSGANHQFAFSDTNLGFGFWTLAGIQQFTEWDRRDIGDIITRPLWWIGPNNGTVIGWVTMSFNPERKLLYDHAVREHLSKLSTS